VSSRSLVIGATALAALVAAAATARGSSEGARRAGHFGTAGVVRTDFGGDDRAEDVALQRDGKIVVAGVGRRDFALARYLRDGRLDRSFGRGGKVRTNLGGRDAAAALAIQPDGKIVAAGASDGDFALVRYLRDGRLDPSFGKRGTARTAFAGKPPGVDFGATAVALQRDGRIVAAGWGRDDAALVRYLPNGRPDRSFGRRGKVEIDFGREFGWASAVAIQSGTRIVAALNGASPDYGAVARFTRRGAYDATFGRGDVAPLFGLADDSSVAAMAVQANGMIVAAGYASFHRARRGRPSAGLVLARYLRSGRVDSRFGTRGRVMTAFATGASAVAVQPNGRIVVVGWRPWTLARYTARGRLDPTFGTNGKVRASVGRRAFPSAVAIPADGGIIVAGGSDGDFLLLGYRADGTLDS
jgi:uncharacterized delta-60 repeat protein